MLILPIKKYRESNYYFFFDVFLYQVTSTYNVIYILSEIHTKYCYYFLVKSLFLTIVQKQEMFMKVGYIFFFKNDIFIILL